MHDPDNELPITAPGIRLGMRRWARPAPEAPAVSPRMAEVRKFNEAATSCPVHEWCNPLKYCPDRDGPPQGGVTLVIPGGQ